MRNQLPERMVPLVTERPRARLLAASVLLFAGFALRMVVASPVAAANELTNGSVTPALGTTQTSFAFSVDYQTSSPQQAASSVTVIVGPASVGLALTAGTATNGTWTGQSTLPAGTWQVTFVADIQGSDPTLVGPTVVVVGPVPTPTPSPVPTPTPTATPPPPPTPTAVPTPSPPGPTAAPNPTFGPPLPSAAPTPSGSATPTPSASRSSSARPTPSASASATDAEESGRPSGGGSPSRPSASATPADAPRDSAGATNPWLFVGGGLAFLGALILGDQWLLRRSERRPAPVEGEQPTT